jgi:hypothetical protein
VHLLLAVMVGFVAVGLFAPRLDRRAYGVIVAIASGATLVWLFLGRSM